MKLYAIAGALALAPLASAQSQALYEVTFEATWSAATHPGAFPSGAHFSPLIGATHNSSARLWEPGGIATTGIEVMAETGSTNALTSEINALISGGTAGQRLTGGAAGSPDTVTFQFLANESHPLVSLVTMIAPSPDWFVGVDSVPLMENGKWIDGSFSLLAWDSGTDSGTSFTSSNQNTNPQDPIALVTGGPFFGNDPLGTFTFTRIELGTPYCGPGVPNSSGATGNLTALGSGSAGDALTLCAHNLPPQKFGYFLVGSAQGFSMPVGSQGNLCLGGALGRFNAVGQIQFTGTAGSMQYVVDTQSLPLNPSVAVLPGSTWYFQGWHREDGGQSNFTLGLEVTF